MNEGLIFFMICTFLFEYKFKKPLFKGFFGYMAETVGFEPTDRFWRSNDFESFSL